MIEKINPQTAYKWMEHKQLIDKINELVEEVNRLGREPVPHYHREAGKGEPNSDLNWDHYERKDK
jgi:hypothetical protein